MPAHMLSDTTSIWTWCCGAEGDGTGGCGGTGGGCGDTGFGGIGCGGADCG
jgi:hypothetical protein